MKKIILFILTVCLAFSFSACVKEEAKKELTTATKATESSTEKIQTKTHQIEAQIMETDDWNDLIPTQINGVGECKVTIDLPVNYTVDNTIILNENGKKYGEIVGVIPYKDGQSAFDTIELGKDYYGITYNEKSHGKVGKFEYNSIMGECPTEYGFWNIYCYALDCKDFAILISLYSDDRFKEMPNEYKQLLSSVELGD